LLCGKHRRSARRLHKFSPRRKHQILSESPGLLVFSVPLQFAGNRSFSPARLAIA
jgi:hypothetical protein